VNWLDLEPAGASGSGGLQSFEQVQRAMTFKPYPVLTLLTAISVVILIMFGNWQWGRFTSKKSAIAAEPEWVTLSGTLVPGTTRQVYGLANGKSVWRDVMLVELDDGAVFVPQTLHIAIDPPAASAIGAPQFYSARGLWHDGKTRGAFAATDKPEAGLFYTFDPPAMAASLPEAYAGRVDARIFEPETLLRTDGPAPQPVANPFVRPELEDRLPPERHFGYALTWWGLAIGLVCVYFALHHQRGRLRLRK
jgi:surfeit locus 1 family protein